MIYIFRSRNSTSARDLAEEITLQGVRSRRTKGEALRNLQNGDSVVCWGDNFAAPAHRQIKVLNNKAPLNKFNEAQTLSRAGVPTIQVSQRRPNVAAAREPFVEEFYNLPANPRVTVANAEIVIQQLRQFQTLQNNRRTAWERQPAVPAETWLPRRNNHVGGNDLLAGDAGNAGAHLDADYFSKKENIVEEYRIHMFKGKSIRAGRKVQQRTRPDGRTAPHQWIRSFDAGWNIVYDGFQSTAAMRDIAKRAVAALELDFAAVDLGKKADGSFIVLEVNRAPGIEGGSLRNYATKIIAWHNGQQEQGDE